MHDGIICTGEDYKAGSPSTALASRSEEREVSSRYFIRCHTLTKSGLPLASFVVSVSLSVSTSQ